MTKSYTDTHYLHQKAIIGKLSISLHPKEFLMLKLRFAPKENILQVWSELWDGISDYDQLPVGCRSLMPTVIRRMQAENISEAWKTIHGLDLSFLVGLPRYVWTRNKSMLNHTKRIAAHVGKDGMEIVAMKGMGELVSDKEHGMMRSTSDLDLLIRPQELDAFKFKLGELGLNLENVDETKPFVPIDQYLFMPTDGTKLYVDLHVMVNKYQVDDRLTELVWKHKVASKECPTLFVPSPRERFWIGLVNVFRLSNWHLESYLKYLNDVLSELSAFELQELKQVLHDGKNVRILQDWQEQIIRLAYDLDIVDKQVLELADKTEGGMDLGSRNSTLTPLRNYINKRINSVDVYKMRHAHFLIERYTTSWQARNEKGNFWRVRLFMIKEPMYQVSTYLMRRFRNLFGDRKTDVIILTEPSNIPTRQVMWEI